MSTLTFDVTQFRAQYPEFANVVDYPDALLQSNWDMATCYISNQNWGRLNGECRQTALNLMTAHLTKLGDLDKAGELNQLLQGATIDKVSVTLSEAPTDDYFKWFLSTTNYGQKLLVLLSMKAVGGWVIGGLPERSAFRKVGGIF